MGAGRPAKVPNPGELYALAHVFYWDLKAVAEGLFRVRYIKPLFDKLLAEAEATELTPDQLAITEQQVIGEIQKGWLAESEKGRQLEDLREELLFGIKFQKRNEAAECSKRSVPVPGEPDVIEELLNTTAPARVKEICRDAFTTRRVQVELGIESQIPYPNWPISPGSVLPTYLSQHAEEFIEAKNDSRYPRSSRPTNRLKQLWFLSRALAGAVHGIRTRTAINLVGSIRPEQMFQRSREGKSKRKIAHRRRGMNQSR